MVVEIFLAAVGLSLLADRPTRSARKPSSYRRTNVDDKGAVAVLTGGETYGVLSSPSGARAPGFVPFAAKGPWTSLEDEAAQGHVFSSVAPAYGATSSAMALAMDTPAEVAAGNAQRFAQMVEQAHLPVNPVRVSSMSEKTYRQLVRKDEISKDFPIDRLKIMDLGLAYVTGVVGSLATTVKDKVHANFKALLGGFPTDAFVVSFEFDRSVDPSSLVDELDAMASGSVVNVWRTPISHSRNEASRISYVFAANGIPEIERTEKIVSARPVQGSLPPTVPTEPSDFY